MTRSTACATPPYGDPVLIEDDTNQAGARNPWRYIGGYYDIEGDGYTKLGARYTDNHSHFTQPDPESGSLQDPLTTLSYGYGQGDPINNQDPTGRSVGDVIGGTIGIGVGLAGAAAIRGATAGIGCVASGIAYGAIGGGLGAGISSEIDDDSASVREDDFFTESILGGVGGGLGAKLL